MMSYICKVNQVIRYMLGDSFLSKVTEAKVLGVLFDSSFTFITQIDMVVNAVSKIKRFFVRNTKLFASEDVMLTLFYSFVHSELE